ncbi:hypothetical protein [Chondrinema litorale]|uniref:hypothetical protein n=1 Tax=Chondrinema litorale TaxID=2994555 RepID=UPI0025432875|nr:hypothetical protein [Chondrinema litorale]UZR93830.1 hypothetical protein OQ292_18445 [Chondrinema litorale]
MKIEISTGKTSKTYLKHFSQFVFPSVVELIYALFHHNQLEATETNEVIYSLIKSLGYNSVYDIPAKELSMLEDYYYQLKEIEEAGFDSEQLLYLLLANLKNGNLIMLVDQQVQFDFNKKIKITDQSVISFIDNNIIQSIEFNTL